MAPYSLLFPGVKTVFGKGDAWLGFMIITQGLYRSFCFHTERPHHIHRKVSRGRLIASSCFDNNLSQNLTPLFCMYYIELLRIIKYIY